MTRGIGGYVHHQGAGHLQRARAVAGALPRPCTILGTLAGFDTAGLDVVETAVGRVGALACWEHYNPLARYALMARHEEIHAAQFPGSLVGQIFADQMEVTIRHHALEAACFVVNATGWLTDAQVAQVCPDERLRGACRGGNCTAIVSPEGKHLADPLGPGEGILVADLDLALVTKRKRMMDAVGHYARPELLSLLHDDRPASFVHQPIHSQTDFRSLDHEPFSASDEPSRVSAGGSGTGRDADGAPDQRVAVLRR